MLQTCLQSGTEESERDVQKGLRSSRAASLYNSVLVDRSGIWSGVLLDTLYRTGLLGRCKVCERLSSFGMLSTPSRAYRQVRAGPGTTRRSDAMYRTGLPGRAE